MGKSLMEDLVIEKLSTVYDPEVPVNIWELGLVYNIEFPKQNEVIVTMTLTAPGCPIADRKPILSDSGRRRDKCRRFPSASGSKLPGLFRH